MGKVVELNFDLHELLDDVEEAVADAIGDGVQYAKHELLRNIPSHRKKTQRSVVGQSEGAEGFVGVQFPSGSRYPKRGTETEQIVSTTWRSIEQQTLDVIEESIEQGIKEVS